MFADHIRSRYSSYTYIDVRSIYVVTIWCSSLLLQYYAIVIVWNALLVLVLILVILAIGVSTRICLNLDSRLKFQFVQHWKFATLLAKFDEVAQFDRLVRNSLRQRVVLVACL